MSDPLATYQFVPYVRQGIAASITSVDTLGVGGAGGLVAAAGFDVTVPVNDQAATAHLDVHGPGDVIGINPRQVVRTDPHPGTTNFESNYFPIVEFDRPDFPWLFTPAAATGPGQDGKLRPWLALVIVRVQPGVEITQTPGAPLPVLEIAAPASPRLELPDLADSWLWAHGQAISGQSPGAGTVAALLTGDPSLNVSRLIGARRLDPDTHYLACVVPTFEVGRLAGLGQPVPPAEAGQLAPAWQSGQSASTSVRLPVYYQFTFATGPAGDFEYLARLLVARPVPSTIGSRPMDVSHPGAGLPVVDASDPNAVLRLEGALKATDFVSSPWTDPDRAAFQAALSAELNAPAALAAAASAGGEPPTPTVGPPLYGQWHAGIATVPAGSAPWLDELNLDPRNRVVAGLGTRVVQADQEDLMASAWQQIGEVNAANAALRQAQLARAASRALHDRSLAAMTAPDILQVTAGAHSRLLDAAASGGAAAALTLSAGIVRSALPRVAAGTQLRRAVRTYGRLARAAYASVPAAASSSMVERMSQGALKAADAWPDPDGTLAMADPRTVLGADRSAALFAQLDPSAMVAGNPADLSALVADLSTASRTVASAPVTAQALAAAAPAPTFQLAAAASAISAMRAIGSVSPVAGATVFAAANVNPFTTAIRVQVPPGAIQVLGGIDVGAGGGVAGGGVAGGGIAGGGGGGGAGGSGGGAAGGGAIGGAGGGGIHVGPGGHVGGPLGGAGGVGGHVGGPGGIHVGGPGGIGGPGGFAHLGGAGIPQAADALEAGAAGAGGVSAEAAGAAGPSSVAAAGGLSAITVEPIQVVAGGASGATFTTFAGGSALRAVTNPIVGIAPIRPIGAAGGGGGGTPADSPDALAFRNAASAAIGLVLDAGDTPADPARPALDLAATRTVLLGALDPEVTIAARVLSRVRIPFPRPPHVDPIEPIMAAPSFPRPMWEALRDLSQDWLLPGIEEIPPNTVTLVETNPTFVASYMVGLNHEMGRELLWREYPTDQRGTYFRRFWGEPEADDIGPITSWSKSGDLGSNVLGGDQPRLVLLVRGELLRRYPGAVIYAVHAAGTVADPQLDDATWLAPLFRGLLNPDITFVGFDLTVAEARGDVSGAGWWFVIAQQPTEPRFGLDLASFPPGPLASPNDLNWGHLAADDAGLTAISYAPALPGPGSSPGLSTIRWGFGAGVQAHVLFQQPVRVAMHATDLLPPAP